MEFWKIMFIVSLVTGFTADKTRENKKEDDYERKDSLKIQFHFSEGLKVLFKIAIMAALIVLVLNIMLHLCYKMNSLF